MKKPIVYIDMDGVLADYDLVAANKTDSEKRVEGLFQNLPQIPGAIAAVNRLFDSGLYEIYFLSTAPWSNPYAWKEKRVWIEHQFGDEVCMKKLILSHNKGLLKGDYLIDDRKVNGVEEFEGKHIHFGSEEFPDWTSVLNFLLIKPEKTEKEIFFERLSSNDSTVFPQTDDEIEWFDEWLETSEEGKKLSKESDEHYNNMLASHSAELTFLVFWLRELHKNSIGNEMDVKVTFVDKKTFIFSSDNPRMKKAAFGESKTVSL